MGLLSFLSGKSPEDIELTGDKFFRAKEFGAAKIEYEKAVRKTQSKFPEKSNLIRRLNEKIRDAREALARTHIHNSRQLMASGNRDDAFELLQLALELTSDEGLKDEVVDLIEKSNGAAGSDVMHVKDSDLNGITPESATVETDNDDEYFSILTNTLPEDIRNAYQHYGKAFKQGFIALNNGDFQEAVEKLSLAMEDQEKEQPLIPLELAIALINTGSYDRARNVLESFIVENPEDIRAYQVLCDLFWVTEDYAAALEMLDQCPDHLRETLPFKILFGETLYQAGQYPEAEDVFKDCEHQFGMNEIVSRALAKTYEAMGNTEKARDTYAGILNGCKTCGVRTDPFIQQRYADLCFECGERSERLLNLYLSIMRDDPDNKDSYYHKVYVLYNALGNTIEAGRYKALIT